MHPIKIRLFRFSDASAVRQIYQHYVLNSAITFDYQVPSLDEYAEHLIKLQQRYPVLVAESIETGEILGYAYASQFKNKAAYDWAVETTIYLASDARGRGIGAELYAGLEKLLLKQGVTNLNACISVSTEDDTQSDLAGNASAEFHRRLGYALVGRFHRCGYKFDRWFDMVWMEKLIAEHPNPPAPFVPFSELPH